MIISSSFNFASLLYTARAPEATRTVTASYPAGVRASATNTSLFCSTEWHITNPTAGNEAGVSLSGLALIAVAGEVTGAGSPTSVADIDSTRHRIGRS
jgi:hypothetical protein